MLVGVGRVGAVLMLSRGGVTMECCRLLDGRMLVVKLMDGDWRLVIREGRKERRVLVVW